MRDNLERSRMGELAGILMIGDGVIGLVRPAGHCLLWRCGPTWWRESVDWFAERPGLVRLAATLELAAGLGLALSSLKRGSTPGGRRVPRPVLAGPAEPSASVVMLTDVRMAQSVEPTEHATLTRARPATAE